MNLKSQVELRGYGTSEGVEKAWDTRGRGSAKQELEAEKRVYVRFPSHRARDYALDKLLRDFRVEPQSYYSLRRDTGYGVYALTRQQVEAIRGQHLVHFTELRGPHDDLRRTWD